MTPLQPPLANMITLGVLDLQRLGWPVVLDTDDFVVFELRGAVLLLPREQLARRSAPLGTGIASSVIITIDRPRTWMNSPRKRGRPAPR
jgi:hypothetical protein